MNVRYNTYLDERRTPKCTECGLTVETCNCEFPAEMADYRLWSHEGLMIRAIIAQVHEDRTVAPDTRYLTTRLIVAVAKMMDDFRKLQLNDQDGVTTPAQILRDGIDVGTLAVRLVCQQQPGVPYRPKQAFEEE